MARSSGRIASLFQPLPTVTMELRGSPSNRTAYRSIQPRSRLLTRWQLHASASATRNPIALRVQTRTNVNKTTPPTAFTRAVSRSAVATAASKATDVPKTFQSGHAVVIVTIRAFARAITRKCAPRDRRRCQAASVLWHRNAPITMTRVVATGIARKVSANWAPTITPAAARIRTSAY